jgi:Uma2 family endonuclease
MQPEAALAEEEYIAREHAAAAKSEFLRGRVYAMAGGSPRHNLIVANAAAVLGAAMRDGPCVVLSSDQRVWIERTGLYTYPDVTVVCGPLRLHPRFADTLVNPTLLVEVLSPSTEAYDRGVKFAHYRQIETLREYLLVSQDEKLLEHYARQGDGSWRLTSWASGQAVALPSAGCQFALDGLYEKIELVAGEPDLALARPKTL